MLSKNGIQNVMINESNNVHAGLLVIISNPTRGKEVVHLAEAYDHLVEEGQLVIVIRKTRGLSAKGKKFKCIAPDSVLGSKHKGKRGKD